MAASPNLTRAWRPWPLLAAGLLGVAVGALGVLAWLVGDAPEVRAVIDQVPERRRAVVRTAARSVAPATDDAAVLVRFVDIEAQVVPGLAVRTRACADPDEPEAPWLDRVADDEGQLEVGECVRLDVPDPDWLLVGPRFVDGWQAGERQQVLVQRRCSGPVEVTLGGAPVQGSVWMQPGGRGALGADGRVELDERACGDVDLWVNLDGGKLFSVRRWFHVEGDETLFVELDDVAPRPAREPRTVEVSLQCESCPDIVRTAGLHRECEGGGERWLCPCWTGEACPVTALWQEAIFDWRYLKEEIARVPPDVDGISVDLTGDVFELRAAWTGAQPCSASMVHRQTGAVARGGCGGDGQVWFGELRPGRWALEIAWSPVHRSVPSASWHGEVDIVDTDVDIGAVGPARSRPPSAGG